MAELSTAASVPRITRAARTVPAPAPAEEDGAVLSAAKAIGSGALSGISMVGNLLDLPGSMVRDILVADNPFDQFLDPMSHSNTGRSASGRDVLSRNILTSSIFAPNKETGMSGWLSDPMEGVQDVLGFGVELGTDPLAWLTGGVSKAPKAAGLFGDLTHAITTAAKPGKLGKLDKGLSIINELDPGTHVGRALGIPQALAKRKAAALAARTSHEAMKAGQEYSRVYSEIANVVSDADQVDGLMRVAAARAQTWASEGTGRTADDYFSRLKVQKSDPSQVGSGALMQGESPLAPTFYSKITEAIDAGKVPNRVDRTQLEKTLLGYGVKKEELADLAPHMDEMFANEKPWENPAAFGGEGNSFLPNDLFGRRPDGKITKDALREMVQDKTLSELKVTNLSDIREPGDDIRENAIRALNNWQHHENELRKSSEMLRNSKDPYSVTKNQETFDTLTRISREGREKYESLAAEAAKLPPRKSTGPAKYAPNLVPGGVPNTAREILFGHESARPFGGGHYQDHPDTFAHARLDDVILPDGSKSLRINEIQSDLHQLGAKEGYAGTSIESLHPQTYRSVQETLNEVADSFGMGVTPDASGFIGRSIEDLYKHLDGFNTPDNPHFSRVAREELEANGIIGRESDNATRAGVTNAPFKKSWHELALKQILRTAAEEGYDSVSLVKGKDIAKAVGGPPVALG